MYLGKLLNLTETQDIELKNRVAKAWAKFAIYRDELTNRCYPLAQRLRLFVSCVQPTFLYGCSSWTLTSKRESVINRLQRQMLRSVVGVKRKVVIGTDGEKNLEDWVSWIMRSTRTAVKVSREHGVRNWVEEISRRKFQWAGHVARRTDGRWTKVMLDWSLTGCRAQARPLTRWCDSLSKFFTGTAGRPVGGSSWIAAAQDRDYWKQMEDDYIEFCRR